MIIDNLTTFANATSVVLAPGTYNLGKSLDNGTSDNFAMDLDLVIIATTGITAAAAGKVRFLLVGSALSTILTDGTQTVLWQSGDIATSTAGIPVGSTLASVELPATLGTYIPEQRWIGLQVVITGSAITAGAVTSALMLNAGKWIAFPQAQN